MSFGQPAFNVVDTEENRLILKHLHHALLTQDLIRQDQDIEDVSEKTSGLDMPPIMVTNKANFDNVLLWQKKTSDKANTAWQFSATAPLMNDAWLISNYAHCLRLIREAFLLAGGDRFEMELETPAIESSLSLVTRILLRYLALAFSDFAIKHANFNRLLLAIIQFWGSSSHLISINKASKNEQHSFPSLLNCVSISIDLPNTPCKTIRLLGHFSDKLNCLLDLITLHTDLSESERIAILPDTQYIGGHSGLSNYISQHWLKSFEATLKLPDTPNTYDLTDVITEYYQYNHPPMKPRYEDLNASIVLFFNFIQQSLAKVSLGDIIVFLLIDATPWSGKFAAHSLKNSLTGIVLEEANIEFKGYELGKELFKNLMRLTMLNMLKLANPNDSYLPVKLYVSKIIDKAFSLADAKMDLKSWCKARDLIDNLVNLSIVVDQAKPVDLPTSIKANINILTLAESIKTSFSDAKQHAETTDKPVCYAEEALPAKRFTNLFTVMCTHRNAPGFFRPKLTRSATELNPEEYLPSSQLERRLK